MKRVSSIDPVQLMRGTSHQMKLLAFHPFYGNDEAVWGFLINLSCFGITMV